MEKKHMLAAFVALAGLVMAFMIGCAFVGVPTAQQTPILTTLLSFLAILGTQIWAKADTDAKLRTVESKLDDNTDLTRLAADVDDPDECDDSPLPPLPPLRDLPGGFDP